MSARLASVVPALIALFLLSACSPTQTVQEQVEPIAIKAQVLPFLSFAPLFIAEEEGFFADQNLDVEFVRISDSASVVPALLRGELDVAATQIEVGLLNAMLHDEQVRMVADKGHLGAVGCAAYGLLASSELLASGGLDNREQLKGLRIAVEPLTQEGYYVERVLESAGLTFDDVGVEDLPPPAVAEALSSGQVDLVHIGEPWITRVKRTGAADLWLPAKEVIPGFQWAVLVYGPNLIEDNPDAGGRFMVAYVRAVRQYLEGKTERNLEIVAKHTELDRDVLEEACWPAVAADGAIDTASVEAIQEWAQEKGLLDSKVEVDGFWDPSFVDHAVGELGPSAP